MGNNAKPCGLWESQFDVDAIASGVSVSDVQWADDGPTLVWREGRDGRGVLVCNPPDEGSRDITSEIDVTGGVGYGGGAFEAFEDSVFFAGGDGRLYTVPIDRGYPEALTPDFGKVASPAVSPDGEWVIYAHTDGENDVLGAVDTGGHKWPAKLVQGADFYMAPTWSPTADRIAWVEWDHPNMPWDGTRLKTGTFRATDVGAVIDDVELVAGGDETSVLQPEYGPEGKYLAYLSDRDGWWHLYVHDLESGDTRQVSSGPYELGGPAWIQGMRYYSWGPAGERIVGITNRKGKHRIRAYEVETGEDLGEYRTEQYQTFRQPAIAADGSVACLAAGSRVPDRVIRFSIDSDSLEGSIARRSRTERFNPSDLSSFESVEWTTQQNGEQHRVFGNYYPPAGDVPEGEKPPALVMIHGGPTSQRMAEFEPAHQFFATRGFAVLDVNYRGSTGYGREYRNALRGNWGIVDVADAVSGHEFLVERGLADPKRIAMMGGSAGGYTIYRALIEHPGVFAAGIVKYGVSDLFSLSMETHKFEQHYTDRLVGTLPEASDKFYELSPVFHADAIEDPVAIFQGEDDAVVPIGQAESIVEQLEEANTPHIYQVYEDEGHGWRRSSTLRDFYPAVLQFLKEHVLFRR